MTQRFFPTILLDALLDTMEDRIIPMTEKGVASGNKILARRATQIRSVGRAGRDQQ